jgi:hypothetical protein
MAAPPFFTFKPVSAVPMSISFSRTAWDGLIPDWRRFLDDDPPSWQLDVLREHARTGRPLGTPAFIADLERQVGRQLAPAKRGRKRRETNG